MPRCLGASAAYRKSAVAPSGRHEGIPGHHLQLAIASELTDLPALRRHTVFNAYAEGWGLYTERLADEPIAYRVEVYTPVFPGVYTSTRRGVA